MGKIVFLKSIGADGNTSEVLFDTQNCVAIEYPIPVETLKIAVMSIKKGDDWQLQREVYLPLFADMPIMASVERVFEGLCFDGAVYSIDMLYTEQQLHQILRAYALGELDILARLVGGEELPHVSLRNESDVIHCNLIAKTGETKRSIRTVSYVRGDVDEEYTNYEYKALSDFYCPSMGFVRKDSKWYFYH